MVNPKYRHTASLLALTALLAACQPTAQEADTGQAPETENKMTVDPHSYARPQEAVVKHLELDIAVDFEAKQLAGTATWTIAAAEGAQELVLDISEITVEKVTLDGSAEATFAVGQEDAIMGTSLTIPITANTQTVAIQYRTAPTAKALQWLAPTQTAGKEQPFLFTQSQAILCRSWIPVQDSPGIRFTYNANVTVPAHLLAVMSAENPQAKNQTGQYSFTMAQPVPAYLMALSVGDLEFRSLGQRSGVYAEPSMIDAAAYEFEELEAMITKAEGLYGPYRWDRYDILVLPPSFPFGGMENPRLTFATPTILAGDRSLTSLVAHELAHSWSGNLVTNATWNDFWLNEGFTVYFEFRIMEALYGKEYADMLRVLSIQDLKGEVAEMMAHGHAADTELKLSLAGRDPDEGMTAIAYDKGALLLMTLETQVGRPAWDAWLKEYFEVNSFKTMYTEAFLEYLAGTLGEEAVATAKGFIYEPGLPETAVTVTAGQFDAVDKALEAWAGGTKPAELGTGKWSTHEWLRFLRNMPAATGADQLAALDDAFGLTQMGNSEISCEWLKWCIRAGYSAADEKLEDFLVQTGRRKFLSPLYTELIKVEGGKEKALAIYEKARPNYHYVSYSTIDAMLGYEAVAAE